MAGEPAATLAFDMFARRAAAAIGAAATALPAVDALIFTGGIGENSAGMRQAISRRLGVIGIGACAVASNGDAILAPGPPAVVVVEAREDRIIAEEVIGLLR